MDEKEIAYNALLKRFRDTSPVLKEPGKLTQSVIGRIEAVNGYKRKNRKMQITGTLSGIAAGLLLCLLIYDVIWFPDASGNKQTVGQGIAIQNENWNNSLKNSTIEELIKERTAWIHRKEQLLLFSQKQ